mmetsp:Transcript_109006/g.314878  ORF Transcript_109006/g.314878 Transcript_109006/m.314878 type:complete len:275 (+) Transcript_109006:243-1067(+)
MHFDIRKALKARHDLHGVRLHSQVSGPRSRRPHAHPTALGGCPVARSRWGHGLLLGLGCEACRHDVGCSGAPRTGDGRPPTLLRRRFLGLLLGTGGVVVEEVQAGRCRLPRSRRLRRPARPLLDGALGPWHALDVDALPPEGVVVQPLERRLLAEAAPGPGHELRVERAARNLLQRALAHELLPGVVALLQPLPLPLLGGATDAAAELGDLGVPELRRLPRFALHARLRQGGLFERDILLGALPQGGPRDGGRQLARVLVDLWLEGRLHLHGAS